MRYRFLGTSGLKVSELCLGTMSFGTRWGFGADEDESRRIIHAFKDAGGNFLDTANRYHDGESEEIVGRAIETDRDRWVVATKYTLAMGTQDPNRAGNSRKNMMRSVEASLKRLKTDYLDLLYVHFWDYTTTPEEVMRGLDDLVRSGKVLYVGVSDAPAWIVSQANTLASLRGYSAFVGLQIEYSLIQRTVERELLPMAEALGLSVLPWAPIGGGVLSGKYTRSAGAPEDTKRAAGNARRLTEQNLAVAKEVDRIADAIGKSSAQVALAWIRARGPHIPIVGARTVAQITDLMGSTEFALADEHRASLDALSAVPLGFPREFGGQMRGVVYGDLDAMIDYPRGARP
ncbi:MAG: aldo/keto reductase [Polyangiaceae bacterium]